MSIMMASNRNKKLLAIFNSEHSIWGITLLLIVILAFVHPQYRSINNYMNVLREASMLGIAGLGLMGVIMTRNTDLSIGTMMALASVVMLKIMPEVGMIPAMLICILLCVGLELLNGFLIVYCNIFAFILTLGMQYIFKGVAHVVSNQKVISATNIAFTQIGNMNLFAGKGFDGLPLPFVILLLFTGVTFVLLHKTGFGRMVYAVGNSEKAARMAGIDVKKVKLSTYLLLGLYVSVAGILISSRLWMASAEMRPSYEFDVITIVVMGGCAFSGGKGKALNTVVSSIFFALIYNVINHFNIDPYWQYIVRAFLLIFAFSISGIEHFISSKLEKLSAVLKRRSKLEHN